MDGEPLDSNFLIERNGISVFRAYREGDVALPSDNWLSTDDCVDADSDRAFDWRELETDLEQAPEEDEAALKVEFPDDRRLQVIAYAIDSGLLTAEGIVG